MTSSPDIYVEVETFVQRIFSLDCLLSISNVGTFKLNPSIKIFTAVCLKRDIEEDLH